VEEKRGALVNELDSLEATLATYRARKDILFLRDTPLELRVPQWIRENLRLPTRSTGDNNKEDFWILNDDGDDVVIGEVKGLTGNARREHVHALVMHRAAQNKPDDFPALLVVNTFAEARTIKDKIEQRIAPDVCASAVKSSVLIVRTVDLLFLADQWEREIISAAALGDMLVGHGGWLRVTRDERESVTA